MKMILLENIVTEWLENELVFEKDYKWSHFTTPINLDYSNNIYGWVFFDVLRMKYGKRQTKNDTPISS